MNKYASMLTAICLAVCLLFFACGNPAAEGDTSATHVEPATCTASDPANDPEPETESPRPMPFWRVSRFFGMCLV